MNIGFYAKSIVTIIAAGLGILVAALADNFVSSLEYVNIGIALVTAIGVYLIPNLPAGPAKVGKTFVAAAGAGLAALATILATTLDFSVVTSSDWLSVLLAAGAAIGVYIVPNEPKAIEANKVVVVETVNAGQ